MRTTQSHGQRPLGVVASPAQSYKHAHRLHRRPFHSGLVYSQCPATDQPCPAIPPRIARRGRTRSFQTRVTVTATEPWTTSVTTATNESSRTSHLPRICHARAFTPIHHSTSKSTSTLFAAWSRMATVCRHRQLLSPLLHRPTRRHRPCRRRRRRSPRLQRQHASTLG